MKEQLWMDEPEAHDFPAALDYLTLVTDKKTAAALVAKLKKTKLIRRKAKDILRASTLNLLPENSPHVAHNLKKVRAREPLSPVLLVRGDVRRGLPLTVADGYHRLCASWYVDENVLIPCRMVSWPRGA